MSRHYQYISEYTLKRTKETRYRFHLWDKVEKKHFTESGFQSKEDCNKRLQTILKLCYDNNCNPFKAKEIEDRESSPTPDFLSFYETFYLPKIQSTGLKDLNGKLQIIENYILPYWKDKKLDRIKYSEIEDFRSYLKNTSGISGRKLSAKTINNILGTLSPILRLAEKKDLILKTPIIEKEKVLDKDKVYISKEQFRNILNDLDSTIKPLVECVLVFGLRRGEVCGLTINDINFERNELTIKRTYNFKTKEYQHGTKTGSIRVLSLGTFTERMRQQIERVKQMESVETVAIADNARLLYPDYYGKQWANTSLYKKYTSVLRECGVREGSLHLLRHNIANYLTDQGFTPFQIQATLGHSTVEMSAHYSKLSGSQTEPMINAGNDLLTSLLSD